MGHIDKKPLQALAFIGFAYILFTFVTPWVGLGLIIVSLFIKSLTCFLAGLGVLFSPRILAMIYQIIAYAKSYFAPAK